MTRAGSCRMSWKPSRELQLQDEVQDLGQEVLVIAEDLCGQKGPPGATTMARAHALLKGNSIVTLLSEEFASPRLLTAALPSSGQ